MKFEGWSALVIALLVADSQRRFLWKTVDHTISTNFSGLKAVIRVTVAKTECKAKKILRNRRTHKLILRYRYFRGFAKSSLYDNH